MDLMARVGRFQVMATLQAARAVALGLELDAAKSWGLNRAVFYAVAKRGFRGSGPASHKPPRSGAAREADERSGAKPPGDEEYTLGGEKAYLAGDPRYGLRFKFGDEEQTPRDFEWQVQRRFADWDSAWSEALETVKSADPQDLKSQHRFYEHVYKPLRDKLATRWSASPSAPPRGSRGRGQRGG
jgi:hypothetical protein